MSEQGKLHCRRYRHDVDAELTSVIGPPCIAIQNGCKNCNEALFIPQSADNTCLSCKARGLCCYYGASMKGRQVVTDDHCEYLDPKTGLCTVFGKRHELNPDCLTIEEMLRLKTVPISCLYVKDKAAYKKASFRRHYVYNIKVLD